MLRRMLIALASALLVLTVAGPAATAAPPQPSVTALSTYFGPVTGGTPVTITGANLKGVVRVLFGDVAVPFTAGRGTIAVTAPAHAAGTVDVRVVTKAGTSAITTGDKFTFHQPAPAGAAVTVSSYVPVGSICFGTGTCLGIRVTTSGFAADVTCRVTDSGYGPLGGPWVQGPNATFDSGMMYSGQYLEVTCDGVTGRNTSFLG